MPKEQLTHPQSRSVSGSVSHKQGRVYLFRTIARIFAGMLGYLARGMLFLCRTCLMHCVFGMEYPCFFRSPMDCFDESLHPYLKIFYQASITCNLVVEGNFMQASHRASQVTSSSSAPMRFPQGTKLIGNSYQDHSILDPALLPPYMIGWGDHQQCGPSGNVTRRLSNSSRKTLLSVPFHSLDTCLTVCLSG